MNKDGVEWKLHLVSVKGREQFYIKGFKDCLVANGVKKVGDSFTLDIIRGGTSPILKICSKVKTPNQLHSRLLGIFFVVVVYNYVL